MIAFPAFFDFAYDLSGNTDIQNDFIEFVRNRPGSRYLALTWNDLGRNEYLRTHFWLALNENGDYTSHSDGFNTFHFTDASSDFTISRDGKPVVSDEIYLRIVCEYLPGAWVPDNPNRHGWKASPNIDSIEIWCEDPDIIFLHEESR